MSIVLCTGAAGDIGKATVAALLQRKHTVIATDLDAARLDGLRAHLALALDVSDFAAWQRTLAVVRERFGHLDVLVNIAGYQRAGVAHTQSVDEVAAHIDVNLKGVIYGCQLAAAHMVERRAGHIVNVASLAAIAPVPGLALYAASKFGVRGFSLALAYELMPHAVQVSVVCPGTVRTGMTERQLDIDAGALIFSGAMLSAEEVARTIVDDVLKRRPVERLVPRGRGVLAKIAGLLPGLSRRLAPGMLAEGRRTQDRLRAGRR